MLDLTVVVDEFREYQDDANQWPCSHLSAVIKNDLHYVYSNVFEVKSLILP